MAGVHRFHLHQQVTLTDTTSVEGQTITSAIRAETITYDFGRGIMVVEGGGTWS